jgi:hypothetical protein
MKDINLPELELRGAMDLLERARIHTYGGSLCVTDIDHFETITLLYHKYLEVKAELSKLTSETLGL